MVQLIMWVVQTAASSTRGLYIKVNQTRQTLFNLLLYTLGNTQDFGDLTGGHRSAGGANATRALRIGQLGSSNVIDYVTIASTGNAMDFWRYTRIIVDTI